MKFELVRLRKDGREVCLGFAPMTKKEANVVLSKMQGCIAEQCGMRTNIRPSKEV